VLNAKLAMSGVETGQFSATITCPIAGLSAWFVISKFLCSLFKKLDGFICFPRANNVLSDWWRAEKRQASRSY